MSNVVLVFGESINDGKSIIRLSRAAKNGLKSVDMQTRRDPVIHLRSADLPKTRISVSEAIQRTVAADSVRRNVLFIIVHQDADAVEPAHTAIEQSIKGELHARGLTKVVAAVPAWEIEAWLMLFPEAIARRRNCWETVDLGPRSVGTIENAKEFLRRALRPKGPKKGRCPDYVETDSVPICDNILSGTKVSDDILKRSESFSSFKNQLEAI